MQDILCYFNVFRLLSNLRLLESLFISSFRGRTFAINIPEVTGSQQCKLFHVGSEDFVHFPLLLILQTHVLQTFQSEIQQNQPVASFFFFFGEMLPTTLPVFGTLWHFSGCFFLSGAVWKQTEPKGVTVTFPSHQSQQHQTRKDANVHFVCVCLERLLA